MSIPVEIPDLVAATQRYGWAYLLTVGEGRAHVVAVTPRWDGDQLVAPVGRRTAANAAATPAVTLCYPPAEPDGYSLIVDGTAEVAEGSDERFVRVAPEGAVLHRPAAPGFAGGPTGCDADCLPAGETG